MTHPANPNKVIGDLRRVVPAEFSDSDVAHLAESFHEELTRVVGVRLSEGLTDRQLQEFEDAPDDDARTAFIEHYMPDYRLVVAATYRELMAHVEQRFSTADAE